MEIETCKRDTKKEMGTEKCSGKRFIKQRFTRERYGKRRYARDILKEISARERNMLYRCAKARYVREMHKRYLEMRKRDMQVIRKRDTVRTREMCKFKRWKCKRCVYVQELDVQEGHVKVRNERN